MNDVPSKKMNGKAITIKKVFSRETFVSITIQAPPAIVWGLLTNVSDFSRWNSTVISIEGEIKKGNRIRLKSTLDEKRIFQLKVKEFEPETRLVWGDNMGNRIYTLQRDVGDMMKLTMTEKIGGPLFPLFAKQIPSFDESFEQFAVDIKKEAEAIQNSKS